jgi:hypothetical protein
MRGLILPLILLGISSHLALGQDLTISNSGETGTSGTNWSSSGTNPVIITATSTATIQASVITDLLNNGISVILVGERDIVFDQAISSTATTTTSLTVKSKRSIVMNQSITGSVGVAMNVVLWTNTDVTSNGGLKLGTIDTKGGHIYVGGGATSTTWNGLTVPNGPVSSYNASIDPLTLVGDLTSGNGEIYIWSGSSGTGEFQVDASGKVINAGSGDITLRFHQVYWTIPPDTDNRPTLTTTGSISLLPGVGTSFGQTLQSYYFILGASPASFTIGAQSNTTTININSPLSINGPISIFGEDIEVSQNITTTSGASGDILLKGTKNLTVTSTTTINTSGGDIIFWANSLNTNGNASQYILLNSGSTLSSGGGKIVLAGGLDDGSNGGTSGDGLPDGYAHRGTGAYYGGVNLGPPSSTGTVVSISSGGGDILIRGETSTTGTNARPGITSQGNLAISAGSGRINIEGISSIGHGIELTYMAVPNVAITSDYAGSGAAVRIAGGSSAAGHIGILLFNNASGNFLVQSTSSIGGGVLIEGSQNAENQTAISYTQEGSSANIQLLSGNGEIIVRTAAIGSILGLGIINHKGTIQYGSRLNDTAVQGITPAVTSSVANVTLRGSSVNLDNTKTTNATTTGTFTIEPVSTSFSAALTLKNLNLTTVSAFIAGKSGNTANLTVESALTTAGPLTLYGGYVTLNNNITVTTSSTVTINATGYFITSNTRKSITTAGGDITINADADANGNGVIEIDYLTINPGSGNIIIRGETMLWITETDAQKPYINGTGSFTFESNDAAFGQDIRTVWFVIDQDANGISGLSLGKPGNNQIIHHDHASGLSINGPVNIYGSSISLSTVLTSTSGNINISATGSVTQAAALTANGLNLSGTGAFTLTNTSNNIVTLAAGTSWSKIGSLHFIDSNGFTVGTVSHTGITASGLITLESQLGNITIAQNVATDNTTSNAIIMNAAKTKPIGDALGGNILISGSPAITTGTNGIVKLYSGRASESTGLTTLVGGSSNVREGVDETTASFSPVLSTNNKYALYRFSIALLGNITIVNSGGVTVNNGWEFVDNTILPTSSSAINIDGSVVEAYLGTNSLTIQAGNITVNTSVSALNANRFVLKANSSVTVAASTNITRTNGDIILWANALNTKGNANQCILLNAGSTLSSGGGMIVLAGGLDNGTNGGVSGDGIPDGHAHRGDGVVWGGVNLGPPGTNGTVITISSGGGDILIRGETSTSNGYPGITSQGNLAINSGAGKINIEGVSSSGHGIELTYGVVPSIAISSDYAGSGPAVRIAGGTSSSGHIGFFFFNAYSGNLLVQSTSSSGGGVLIEGTNSAAGNNAIVYSQDGTNANIQFLSGSGDIIVRTAPIGTITQGLGRIFHRGLVRLGTRLNDTPVQGITPSVTSSNANVILRGSGIYFDSSKMTNTGNTGTFTIEPVGDNFSEAITIRNLNLATVSAFTGGKVGNTGNITLASALSVAGPISFYGGILTISSNITSSATGDILLKALSNANNSIINYATITKSGGTGTLTFQGNGKISNSGTINTSGSGVMNVVMWSDYDNTNDGGTGHYGTISTNGGHVWMGGSNSNGGSYSWNGLTVGDGPSVGAQGANHYALDLMGNITTSGGDYLAWAGPGVAISGIGVDGDEDIIDVGTGDIILITNRFEGGSGAASYFKHTGGTFTIVPNGGNFGTTFNWNPTAQSKFGGTGMNFPGTGSFDWLGVFNVPGLKNLTIGQYAGMSSGGNPVVLSNTSNVIVTTDIVVDGPISIYGAGLTINGNVTSSSGGDITINVDNAIGALSSAKTFTTTGLFKYVPRTTTFSASITYPITNLSLATSGLLIGSPTNTATLTFGSTTTVNGPITAYAGNLNINRNVTAQNNNINLHASGDVTQSAAGSVIANSLGLHGSGNYTLTSIGNNVLTLAGGNNTTPLGSLKYVDSSLLFVGTVNATGITASGTVEISTMSGHLQITEPVKSTLSTGDAVKLFADKDASAGTVGDGQIKFSDNGAITNEAGARALLYTGIENQSTGVLAAVGGAGNTRTSVDANTSLSAISPPLPSSGKFALFRISASPDDANLSSLSFSSGTLTPTFTSSVTSYTLTVSNSVTSITLTPSTSNPNATIKVNGSNVVNGQTSGAINLNIGSNAVNIVVTSQDGTTSKTYVFIVIRSVGTPEITSISPSFAGNGASVSIRGNKFTGVTTVKFGEVNATSFTVVSDTLITAIVGAAKSGAVMVQNAVGSDSKNIFTYKVTEYLFEDNLEDQTNANLDGQIASEPAGGSLSYSNGVSGKAVCFDGKAYMKLPDNLIKNLGYNFTLSLRFKTTKPGVILGYQNAAPGSSTVSNYIPLIMVQSDGKLSGILWTGSQLKAMSTQRVDDGNWHKVDMTAGPNSVTIYIDGVMAATRIGAQITHLDMSLNQLGMGFSTNYDTSLSGWQGLRGCVDNFLIMDRELTQSEIQQATQVPVPTITSFTPQTGSTNDEITISGTNLSGTTEVKIGGTKALNLKIDSDTQIKATVALGTTGVISALTAGGSVSSAQSFTYIVTLPPVLSITQPEGKSLITDPGTGSKTLSINIANNETFIADFDADKSVTWTLVDGLNKSMFTIDGNGKLDLTGPVRPGTYQVLVKATDVNSNISQVLVTVIRDKQTLLITADAKTKVYGTADPALTYQVSGLLSGDTFTGALSRALGDLVGEYAISQGTLNVNAPNDYQITFQPATFTITPKPIVLKGATGITKTYDGGFTMPDGQSGVQALEGMVTGDDLVINGKPVFSRSNAGSDIPITQGTVVLGGTKAVNYEVSWVNGSGTIQKAVLSVSVNDDAKFVTTNDASGYAGVAISGYVGAEDESALNFSQLSITRNNNTVQVAGKYVGVLQASGLSATNYSFAYTAGDYTIVPADQLMIRLSPTTAIYGQDPVYNVIAASYYSATGSQIVDLKGNVSINGNQVGLTDGVGGTAQLSISIKNASLSTASYNKVGIYDIEPTSITESSSNFSNTITLIGSLTITRRVISPTVTSGKIKPYDANRTMMGLSMGLAGVLTGDIVSVSGEGMYGTKNVATGKEYTISGLKLAGTDVANYSLSTPNQFTATDGIISTISLTLTGATGVTKAYDATTNMPAGQKGYLNPVGLIPGDQITIQGSPQFSQFLPGSNLSIQKGSINLGGSDAGNYAVNWTNGTGTITSAKLLVRANDDSKFVTEADPAGFAGVSVTGFSGNDNISMVNLSGLSITRSNTSVNTAGVFTGVLIPSGVTAANYQIEYVPGNFVISAADQLKVELKPVTTVYGNTPTFEILQAGYYSSSGGQVVNLTDEVTINGSQITVRDNAGGQAQFTVVPKDAKFSTGGHLNAGSYLLQAGNVSQISVNFSNTMIFTGAMTVNPKPLSVSVIDGKKKSYDGVLPMPAITLALSGKLNGDEVLLSGSGTFTTKAVGTAKTYTVQLNKSGKDLSNYSLTQTSITGNDGEITKRPLAVAISAQTKLYDGNTSVTTSFTNDRLSGDIVNITYNAEFSSKNAGTQIPVTISNVSYSGDDASNYDPKHSSPLADILPRKVTVTPNAGQMKERGAQDPDTLRYTFSPALITGDRLTGKLSRQMGEDVGVYPIVQGSLSGEVNYTITMLPASFQIIERVPPVLTLNEPKNLVIKKDPDTGLLQLDITINERTTFIAEFKANEQVSWSISGGKDQALFVMDASGKLSFRAPQPTGIYGVVIQATDRAGATTDVLVWVSIQGVDTTAPLITGPSNATGAKTSSMSLQENKKAVFVFKANETVNWSISGGNDASLFTFAADTLKFKTAPDYEIPADSDRNNLYEVVVKATDTSNNFSDQTVQITIIDLDDTKPLITGPSGGAGATASNLSMPENKKTVHTFKANEPVSWAINGGDDAQLFSFSQDTLVFKSLPDFELPADKDKNNLYEVVIKATDPSGNFSEQKITITITNIDDNVPLITGPSGGAGAESSLISIPENKRGVALYRADKPVTWSVSGGNDAALFAFKSDSLLFSAAPDFEKPSDQDKNNAYLVVVRARDQAGNASEQRLTVVVTDVDDSSPLITGPSGGAGADSSLVSMSENKKAVAAFRANESVRWSISGGSDAALFEFVADSLLFRSPPDYERPADHDKNNQYTLVVRGTDAAGNYSDQKVRVIITDVVEVDPRPIPKEFVLEGNYPNPFRGQTTIPIQLPVSSRVTIEIYDFSGKRVKLLLSDKPLDAGRHLINLDARDLPSDMYIVRMMTRLENGQLFNRSIMITLLNN